MLKYINNYTFLRISLLLRTLNAVGRKVLLIRIIIISIIIRLILLGILNLISLY